MKRYIVIQYDPNKVFEDERDYDLYEGLRDHLDSAGANTYIVEFERKPTSEGLSDVFGGKWK